MMIIINNIIMVMWDSWIFCSVFKNKIFFRNVNRTPTTRKDSHHYCGVYLVGNNDSQYFSFRFRIWHASIFNDDDPTTHTEIEKMFVKRERETGCLFIHSLVCVCVWYVCFWFFSLEQKFKTRGTFFFSFLVSGSSLQYRRTKNKKQNSYIR